MFVSLVAWSSSWASAQESKGPYVSLESSSAAKRAELEVLLPLAQDLLGMQMILRSNIFSEQRTIPSEISGQISSDAERKYLVSSVGSIFLVNVDDGNPVPFFGVGRYGALKSEQSSNVMSEYFTGLAVDRTAWSSSIAEALRFHDSDKTSTIFYIRARRFPGFTKWLYYVEHVIYMQNGWSLEVAYPSHAIVSRQNGKWKISLGGRAVSREYPWRETDGDDVTRGWIDGYSGYGFLGVRREIISPLYASFETGAQMDELTYRRIDGEELVRERTAGRFFVRIALETWIKGDK